MSSCDAEQDLRTSSRRIGKLYPVLFDSHGSVIDGNRRLAADANWPRVKLDHIKSREQLITAKLVSNVCRREISAKEKSEMLQELADICIQKGTKPQMLAKTISELTGMSYRWVMEYLPNDYKTRPGLGGPVPMLNLYKSNENIYKSKVATYATFQIAISRLNTDERILSVKNYSNTNFVHIIIESRYYAKIEEIAEKLNTSPETLINSVLLSVVKTCGARNFSERLNEITA